MILTVAQTWYKELKTVNHAPELDLESRALLIDPPVEAQRMLHSRKDLKDNRTLWLLQIGSGENVWFTWADKNDMMMQDVD